MPQPNFGESQLQHCVNAEITNRILQDRGVFVSPIIPTLPDEFIQAFDSGFFFPWRGAPDPDHHGANFFIQYKISNQLGRRGNQYADWGEPYFRFSIPHSVVREGRYIKDFHQWDALKTLAQAGYATFYATNHVLERNELFNLAAQRRLLDTIPFLDVSSVNDRHDCATFLPSSRHFILHSDPERIPLGAWESANAKIEKVAKRALGADNERTFHILETALKDVTGAETFFRAYRTVELEFPRSVAPRVRFILLRSAFYRFFDIVMLRT